MFYMFHHIPKCGGTSFNKFMDSIFNVVRDYHNPGGAKANPELFEKYRANPVDLRVLRETDCISGHYNMQKIFLKDRYPHLEELQHKKFSIIREPFQTAKSGVYFNIKRGVFTNPEADPNLNARRVLSRANIMAKVLGIQSVDEIDAVLDRYWFIAPLDEIVMAARLIEEDVGRRGSSIDQVNTTEKPEDELDPDLEQKFKKASALDYEIYNRASERFSAFWEAPQTSKF